MVLSVLLWLNLSHLYAVKPRLCGRGQVKYGTPVHVLAYVSTPNSRHAQEDIQRIAAAGSAFIAQVERPWQCPGPDEHGIAAQGPARYRVIEHLADATGLAETPTKTPSSSDDGASRQV